MEFLKSSLTEADFIAHVKKFEASLKLFPDFYLPIFSEVMNSGDVLPFHIPYICPLCLRNRFILLKRGDKLHQFFSTTFDIDHYPPQSVGGRKYVIVCEQCNNLAGTAYDHTLEKKVEFLAFSKGNIGALMKTDAQITGVKGKYASQMIFDPDGKLQISLKKKGKKLPLLDRWLTDPKRGYNWKMTLTYHEPKPDEVRKALLKSAYLYCFAHWGYDFVLSYTGEMMRNVLKGKLKYPYENVAPFWVDNTPNIPKGVCAMQMDGWESFSVNIPLKARAINYETVAVVPIPTSSEEGWKKLERFSEVESAFSPSFNVTFTEMLDGI